MEAIQGIFDGFREFLQNASIMEANKTVYISYILLPYDLIDDDLDFDEAHYATLLLRFDALIESEIINQIKDGKGYKYQVNKGKMLFRNHSIVQHVIEYETGTLLLPQATSKQLVVKNMKVFMEV
jgi:hypothetical protein